MCSVRLSTFGAGGGVPVASIHRHSRLETFRDSQALGTRWAKLLVYLPRNLCESSLSGCPVSIHGPGISRLTGRLPRHSVVSARHGLVPARKQCSVHHAIGTLPPLLILRDRDLHMPVVVRTFRRRDPSRPGPAALSRCPQRSCSCSNAVDRCITPSVHRHPS